MSIEIVIGDRVYKTKKAAKEAIRKVLYAHQRGVRIPEPDHSFLLDMLDLHEEAAAKIGCGVAYFTTVKDGFGNIRFDICRPDGTRQDFSFENCLSGKTHAAMVNSAMRTAIHYQKVAFRNAAFSKGQVRCPYTNEVLTPNTCHVDHSSPTYEQIKRGWFTSQGITADDVKISASGTQTEGRTMTDQSQVQSWVAHHQHYVRFRLLSPLGNLSHAKIEANKKENTDAS